LAKERIATALEFDKDASYLISRLEKIEKEEAILEILMDVKEIARTNVVTNAVLFQRKQLERVIRLLNQKLDPDEKLAFGEMHIQRMLALQQLSTNQAFLGQKTMGG